MKASIEFDSGYAEEVRNSIDQDLNSDKNIEYSIEKSRGKVEACIKASKLGHLRGATDTFFRLSMLAEKIMKR